MISLFVTFAALAQDPIEDDLPEATLPAEPAATSTPLPNTPAAPVAPKRPVSKAEIQTAVDAWYGKPVPPQAVCSAHPALPAGITTEVVAVGVTKKNAGCRLVGLMVGGLPVPTADGLSAAVNFAELDAATKLTTAREWVTGVLLNFDHPMEEGTAKVGTKGSISVTVPYARRAEEFHVTENVPGTFTFDSTGKLTANTGTANARWRTDFYQQEVAVQGLSSGVVDAAITSVGAAISECFDNKMWAEPGFAGATRIAMVVSGGKMTKVGAEEESDAELTRCYVNALYRAVWFPTAKGSAVWSFTIIKAPL